MGEKARVLLRRAETYNPVTISRIIQDGLRAFGLGERVRGRVTIKPNVVMAHHRVTPSAYTRPEFLDGLLTALEANARLGTSVTVAEKCGAAIPTSRMFRRAGYYRLRRCHRFKLEPIELARRKTVALARGKIHASIRTSRAIAERDLLVYAPKLKTNSLSHGMTAALKLNIGILCDGERMWNHNYNLDEKIVDLLEVGYPDFIATDAIEASCGGNHLTQHGHPLGAVIMATNPLAHDVVCAHILHLDPAQVGHLAAARERGYGPIDIGDIEIDGDITLDELRSRTAAWNTGFIRVENVDCNVKVLSGEPYCTGGCHGVFLDWLYMIKDRKPGLWAKMPRWTVVIGKYRGDVTADRLVLLGKCTEIEGRVNARHKRKIGGCPPKHKTLVLLFFLKAGIINPLFRLDLIIDAYPFLFLTWLKRFFMGRF